MEAVNLAELEWYSPALGAINGTRCHCSGTDASLHSVGVGRLPSKLGLGSLQYFLSVSGILLKE